MTNKGNNDIILLSTLSTLESTFWSSKTASVISFVHCVPPLMPCTIGWRELHHPGNHLNILQCLKRIPVSPRWLQPLQKLLLHLRAVHVLSPTYVVTLTTNDIYWEISPKLSTGTDGADYDINMWPVLLVMSKTKLDFKLLYGKFKFHSNCFLYSDVMYSAKMIVLLI